MRRSIIAQKVTSLRSQLGSYGSHTEHRHANPWATLTYTKRPSLPASPRALMSPSLWSATLPKALAPDLATRTAAGIINLLKTTTPSPPWPGATSRDEGPRCAPGEEHHFLELRTPLHRLSLRRLPHEGLLLCEPSHLTVFGLRNPGKWR